MRVTNRGNAGRTAATVIAPHAACGAYSSHHWRRRCTTQALRTAILSCTGRGRRSVAVRAFKESGGDDASGARTITTPQAQPKPQPRGTGQTAQPDAQVKQRLGPAGSPGPEHSSPGSVLAFLLGGGSGDYQKLFPLTSKRALPAIPIAGQHRLVDIPISNLLNSGVNKIYVLTQFQSQSLNRYLTRTYNLSDGVPVGGRAFLEVLTSNVSPDRDRWSEGTADAVRQFLWIMQDVRSKHTIEDVIILPSDQMYVTDFTAALDAHRQHNADVTILSHPVDQDQAEQLGVIQVRCVEEDEACHVSAFMEKPQGPALEVMRTSPDVMRVFERTRGASGISDPCGGDGALNACDVTAQLAQEDDPKLFIASTGIYIFKRSVLVKVLEEEEDANDFGTDLIPRLVDDGVKVITVSLSGPWRDLGGSIRDFYDASLSLLSDGTVSILDALRLSRMPIYKAPEALPPVTYDSPPSRIAESYVAPGCRIGGGCKINHSIVGIRSHIGAQCTITDSVIMGADYYGPHTHTPGSGNTTQPQTASDASAEPARAGAQRTQPPLGIGARCVIRGAIVDKNAKIGNDVQLINQQGLHNSSDWAALGVWIRDGIVVVSKSATIPDGTVI